eukprot:scaffold224457_cov21-Tisochrysis_lutea.AAC.2
MPRPSFLEDKNEAGHRLCSSKDALIWASNTTWTHEQKWCCTYLSENLLIRGHALKGAWKMEDHSHTLSKAKQELHMLNDSMRR